MLVRVFVIQGTPEKAKGYVALIRSADDDDLEVRLDGRLALALYYWAIARDDIARSSERNKLQLVSDAAPVSMADSLHPLRQNCC